MVAIPGMKKPEPKQAPIPAPATLAAAKLAEVPNNPHDVLPIVRSQADAAGMPEDEPLRIMNMSLAAKLDRLEVAINAFGPGAGKIAADEAARIVSSWMPRALWRIDLWRWSLVGFAMSTCVAVGLFIGYNANVPTSIGHVPPDLARTLPLQDLQGQYAACRNQPSDGSLEWCLMPWIKSVRPVGR